MCAAGYAVVDLFSGAGGMSYGFHRHPCFRVEGAADAQIGKPSAGHGKLQCNQTYEQNIGLAPARVDLSTVEPAALRAALGLPAALQVSVLSTCPPCTGFSRANPNNHIEDDRRNSLVRRSAQFAVALGAAVVVMENARELIRGNFSHHYDWFRSHLEANGYRVAGDNYVLTRFGLPQIRERAIVIAVRRELPLRTLDCLWEGWETSADAVTVRRAFEAIPAGASGLDVYPHFASSTVRRRIRAIPHDGGSWIDLLRQDCGMSLLTESMKRTVALNKLGSYPDVYGRMAWDRPSPTIKRECSHVGNGRYTHPEEDRLCTVREMAALQGFPGEFRFNGAAVSNMYRHIGDAVPPLISFQLACLCHWILTGGRPGIADIVLPGCHLNTTDLSPTAQLGLRYA